MLDLVSVYDESEYSCKNRILVHFELHNCSMNIRLKILS